MTLRITTPKHTPQCSVDETMLSLFKILMIVLCFFLCSYNVCIPKTASQEHSSSYFKLHCSLMGTHGHELAMTKEEEGMIFRHVTCNELNSIQQCLVAFVFYWEKNITSIMR